MFYLLFVIFLLLFVAYDFNYLLRILFTVILQRFLTKKLKVTDETRIYGLCTTNDLTALTNHMNNARYLRELDFARYHFLAVTRLYDDIKRHNGDIPVAASTIRYRKPIFVFQTFKITTKLIWWDSKALYFEHKFVTGDGFVRAVALAKQIVTNLDVAEFMKSFTKEEIHLKSIPEDLKLWLELLESSSKKMRQ